MFSYGVLILVLCTDLAVVITIDVIYVYARIKFDNAFVMWAQLGLATSKSLWNVVAVRMLVRWYSAQYNDTNSLQPMRLRLFILVANNVFAPLVATLFTDERCFAEILFLPPHDVTVEYDYPFCYTTNPDGSCFLWSPLPSSYTFAPPFLYSSQCTSALLVNYIPIVIYVYTLHSLIAPVVYFTAMLTSSKRIPESMAMSVPGMLWPHENGRFPRIIHAKDIAVSQMLHLAVLLTFGVASPALTAALVLIMTSQLYINEILLGRYLLYMKQLNDSLTKEQLLSLEICCVDVWRFPKFSVWMILAMSAYFFGIASCDISSDDVGLAGGAGVATSTIVFLLFLWAVAKQKHLERFVSRNDIFGIVKLAAPAVGSAGPMSTTHAETAGSVEIGHHVSRLEPATTTATTVDNPLVSSTR